jgi:hypothetical protein
MRIYLDDDSIAKALVGMLRKTGHDVRVPAEIGLTGADDVIHLTRAISKLAASAIRVEDEFVILNHWR